MRLSKLVGLLLVGAMFCATSPVGAQQIDDQMRATARSLADEGITLFDQRKYSDALDRFERADAIVHAPTVGLLAARTLEKLGRLVEASERYRAVMNVTLDEKAPEAFRDAQTTASNELAALTPRIPSLEIVVEGEGSDQARVTLDGKPVPKALIGAKTLINPGVHRVEADSGNSSGAQDLTIAEKQALRAVIKLEPKSTTGDAIVTPPPPPDEKSQMPPGAIQRYAAYGAFGLGGAGLIMGIGAGIAAILETSNIDAFCTKNTVNEAKCRIKNDPDYLAAQKPYNTDRTISTVGFVLGGVGVAAGVALFLTAPKAPKTDPTKASIQPFIGLGSAGLHGTF